MLNKRIIISIVVIVVVVAVAVLLSLKQQELVNGDLRGDAHGLLAFKDPGLVLYYTDVVLSECPYLQPNAAQYSSCILTMREAVEKSSGQTESEKEASDAYCSLGASLSADDYTTGFADLYNICMLYQASKLPTRNSDIGPKGDSVYTVHSIVSHYPHENDNSETVLMLYEKDSEHVRKITCLFPPNFQLEGSNEIGWKGIIKVKVSEQPVREYMLGEVGYYCERAD